MTDAGWDTDFEVALPEDLKSGIYAIRLVPDGDEAQAYHCVFAVRPPRRKPTGNRVCFLMPTASYLAYANHRLGLDVPGTEVGMGRLVEIDRRHDLAAGVVRLHGGQLRLDDNDPGLRVVIGLPAVEAKAVETPAASEPAASTAAGNPAGVPSL